MLIKQVILYEGTVPKSGKQCIEFSGHKLCHRSVGKDKSDLLVHIDTRIILRSYPLKTDRSIVLNDMAENVEKLEHFLANREAYEIVDKSILLQEKIEEPRSVLDLLPEPHNISYKDVEYDTSCVTTSCSSKKKSYNVGEAEW